MARWKDRRTGLIKPAKSYERLQKAKRGCKTTELGWKNNHPTLKKAGSPPRNAWEHLLNTLSVAILTHFSTRHHLEMSCGKMLKR